MGIQYEKNAVVITEAPAMNYFGNHVRLPKDYGTPAYEARPDVKAIKATVRKSLDDLDAATGHPTEPHFDAYCDKLFTIPELAAKNLDVPFVEIPMPKMGLKARREAMKDVNFLAQFLF